MYMRSFWLQLEFASSTSCCSSKFLLSPSIHYSSTSFAISRTLCELNEYNTEKRSPLECLIERGAIVDYCCSLFDN
jgi:hypothetical protein